VYTDWASAKAEKDAYLPNWPGHCQKFSSLEQAQAFVGGERLCRAWDLFRADDREGAEEIFAVVDPEGHGKIRVGEVRKQRLAVAEAQAAEALKAAARGTAIANAEAGAAEAAAAALAKARGAAALADAVEEARQAERGLAEQRQLRLVAEEATRKAEREAEAAADLRRQEEKLAEQARRDRERAEHCSG
jgi:hypothetical protein